MREKTTERNREIFASFRAGKTMRQLAGRYGLAVVTVASILRAERYKLEVSVDEFYCGLRRPPGPHP